MVLKDKECPHGYVKDAVVCFRTIISNNHKDLDNFNREYKGELFVLRFLALRSTSVLPFELSAALQSSAARISALLGALEKKGQICRDIDKSNRRNILVTITDAGRERIENEVERMQGLLAQIFTEMGETDTTELIRLAKRFTELSRKYFSECKKD